MYNAHIIKKEEMMSNQKITNAEFAAKDKWFKVYCENFCFPATTRQASKYRMKKGIIYKLANRLMD